MNLDGFRFGLEGEYLLVDRETFRPLWHTDLAFEPLNHVLEQIDFEPLLDGVTLEGLELDPPHRRLMPFYVEGYGLPDAELTKFVDLLPKGVEIRTPVCPSIETCLEIYEVLYGALQNALASAGYRAVPWYVG
jgi:carboxylate-amine ligase